MSLFKLTHVSHVLEELSSIDVVHNEVDANSRLENIVHVHNERMVYLKHDKALQVDVLQAILVNDDVLSHAFKCVVLLRAG